MIAIFSCRLARELSNSPDCISSAAVRKHRATQLAGEPVFVVPESLISGWKLTEVERPLIRRYLRPSDVQRYTTNYSGYSVIYAGNKENKEILESRTRYPNIIRHLDAVGEFYYFVEWTIWNPSYTRPKYFPATKNRWAKYVRQAVIRILPRRVLCEFRF